EWQIPLYQNEIAPEPLTENIISSVTGEYEEGRKIIYDECTIFYINRRGEREKLNYMGKGIFQHAEKSWLRLVMPYTDKLIPDFQWVWEDGGEPQTVKRAMK